jgi:hypothetical protein
VAHAFFDRQATTAIAARAEHAGTTVNSFLLWSLDRAVYPLVARPAPLHRWSISVNMLGAAPGSERMANAATMVGILLDERGSAADIRKTIGDRLRRHAHWGSWDAMRLLARSGERSMRRYAARYYARGSHSWVGGFSNVGGWDVDAGYWYAVQPVTITQPIGAAAVTMGGRLGLALHVHASLAPVDVTALMGAWRGELEPPHKARP